MPFEVQPGLATAGEVSVHTDPRTVASPVAAGARSGVIELLERHALFVAVIAAAVVLSLAGAAMHLSQDGYLALVAGRIIANQGIPHHDYLTVMTHGVQWVDQQWLSQFLIYELQRIGGYALFVVVYVGLTALALGMAVAAALKLGGTERQIIRVLPLSTFFFLATAVSIRTQGFAYPLFVATLWLCAAEVREPTRRRVFLVFPILVLWANMHGSVTMGVGVAVLYGLTLLASGMRTKGLRGLVHGRGIAFVAGPPICLLATPYGFSIVHYYHSTLLNPQFSKLVTEWRPVTSEMIIAVPFLLLVGITLWLLGRSGSKTPLFDHIVLAALAFGGIIAVRNITWFGLATIVLMPPVIGNLGKYGSPMPRRRKLNLSIAWASLALAAIGIMTAFARPSSWFENTYDSRAVTVVANLVAKNASAKIFADVRFADWLVWRDPALSGHIAYDTSFELLNAGQLSMLSAITSSPLPGAADPIGAYSVMVLNPKLKATNRALLSRAGAQVVLRSKKVIVATKPVT